MIWGWVLGLLGLALLAAATLVYLGHQLGPRR